MANTNARRSASNSGFTTTFIDVRLAKADGDQFRAYMQQGNDELALEMATLVSQGHKLSLSWDNKNVCFIASVTCRDEKAINYDCCITSRSDDWFEAIMLCVFKAVVLANGKAWQEMSEKSNWG